MKNFKKKVKKNEKGITLVSLVITIIVLLILATVAISLAIDGNGLFKRAEYAAGKWNDSVLNESTTIENSLELLNKVVIGETPGVQKDRKVIIPEGYVASDVEGENSIEDGLVIYEGEEPVNEENHEKALTTRNQYVWIPVDDINDMIMCQECLASGTLEYNETDNTLQCTIHKNSTKLAGKLYAGVFGKRCNGF